MRNEKGREKVHDLPLLKVKLPLRGLSVCRLVGILVSWYVINFFLPCSYRSTFLPPTKRGGQG